MCACLTRPWKLAYGLSGFASSLALLLASATSLQAEEPIEFSQQIQPLLSDRCFACHGPDKEHREGGLRLDLQEHAFGTADSGEPIIVPNKPEESLLYQRITSDIDALKMPPEHARKQLSAGEIELIRTWIEQGAEWKGHWAYQPLVKPEVPTDLKGEVSSPIDAFVRKKLQAKGMQPNRPAEPVTLLRRVTLDLTGLPPTPEEVDAFLADDSPHAYENVVDRLLASPRFGEHQAHYWLDAARYGDTHGLHLDNYREMWPYRDWVIQAFNENKPYDEFIIEQLAGDLLENPTEDQIIATGFNRCHVTTNEGGSIKEEVYVRNVVDRVNTFGTVFLGATFDCTRCHDHKFDPLTQKDYYSLFAFFNSMDGSPMDGNKEDPQPVIAVPNEEQEKKQQELTQQLAQVEKQLKELEPLLVEEQLAWENQRDASAGEISWNPVQPETYVSRGGAKLELLDDGSILASGPNPAKEVYEVVTTVNQGPQQAIRLEGLTHESLTNGRTGRSSNSNVVLTEFEAYIADGQSGEEWKRISFTRASADHEQSDGNFKIENAIDGNPSSGWAVAGHQKEGGRVAHFVAAEPFGQADPYRLKVLTKYESPHAQHQFGRFRLSLTNQNPLETQVPANIQPILAVAPEKRSKEQKETLQKWYREQISENSEWKSLTEQQAKLKKEREELKKQIPTTLVFKEKEEPKPAYLLKRGEYDQKGEEVKRRTPDAFVPFKEKWPNNRLGLAYWLVSDENPLTARVAVNRFWQHLFGIGLVKTSEDFGSQGERPSHPELLDWLAADFRENGWDVKATIRKIVLSETYRQSSQATPQLWGKDPENRLLARGPRHRLDAEMLRDQALYVAGLLKEKVGGPSVKPPQPDGLWHAVAYSNSNTARFEADQEPEKIHRRTLYTFLKRTALAPQLGILDVPSRESSCVRRERTNTPMQALMFFNDPQYLECAQGLAARTLREAEDQPEAIARKMYRRCTCFEPEQKTLNLLVGGYEKELERFRRNPESARKLLASVPFPAKSAASPEKLAAWTLTANVLLSLDVVVTKN